MTQIQLTSICSLHGGIVQQNNEKYSLGMTWFYLYELLKGDALIFRWKLLKDVDLKIKIAQSDRFKAKMIGSQ